MKLKRCSGILTHITSLPGKYGIGTMGKEAFEFVDFLIEAKQKIWQVLPVNPTGYTNCPYSSISAFAGNPYMINLDILIEEKLLKSSDIKNENFNEGNVDFGKIYNFIFPVLKKAYINYMKEAKFLDVIKFENFCKENEYWLENYAVFAAIKDHFGGKSWFSWDEEIKKREKEAVEKYKKLLSEEILYHKFIQYLFFKQWSELKDYANRNGIKIVGDIPIYVCDDSADVWGNNEVFQFDNNMNPKAQAGVPPDYFSATGQLWGNPVFNWEYLKETNFKWWIDRVRTNVQMYDILRFDHFRGFDGYWAVPWEEKTAVNGRWEKAYGKELFAEVRKEFGDIEMIAEDLGVITDDVRKLRDEFGFMGMKILQFAFDSKEESDFLPHNYIRNSIVYTGSLDNDTIAGWYKKISPEDQKYFREYMNCGENDISWNLIRGAWASVSTIAVTTMQDLLSLGDEARMNMPGTVNGNWEWRYKKSDINADLAGKLRKITEIYHR